jgi:hypothetical protein
MMTNPPRASPPASQGLHYSFEKAGLTLDRQAIPWNAEAVLVEAIVRLPHVTPEGLREFGLHLPGQPRIAAEASRPGDGGLTRVFFRLAVPSSTMPAEVRWRDRSLGQINLPLLTQDEFLNGLRIVEPTVHVRIKDETHPCGAYVGVQAKEVILSMLLSSPTSLAPLADIEVGIDIADALGDSFDGRTIKLGSEQLAARQALIVVPFPKPKAWAAQWTANWIIGQSTRAARTVRVCRPTEFRESLRISTTRLYLEGFDGLLPLARFAPASLDGIARLGPVFLVSSGIAGMAAQAEFHVRVLDRKRKVMLEMPAVRTLVTDGPTVIAPGTLGRDDAIDAFELWCGPRCLGELPLAAVPTAAFTGEGGIAAGRADFAWSPDAEEQLQQKLRQLLDGG